jgi:hypothetical protein
MKKKHSSRTSKIGRSWSWQQIHNNSKDDILIGVKDVNKRWVSFIKKTLLVKVDKLKWDFSIPSWGLMIINTEKFWKNWNLLKKLLIFICCWLLGETNMQWFGYIPRNTKIQFRSNKLRQPLESFGKNKDFVKSKDKNWAKRWSDSRIPSLYPCRLTTEHMNTSTGRTPLLALAFVVYWIKLFTIIHSKFIHFVLWDSNEKSITK